MNPTPGETCRIVLVMTHFPKVVMGCESPLMRGYQHQLIRDSAAESLICAERDASGLCERDDSGLTPVGSAGRRIAAKLASLQSIEELLFPKAHRDVNAAHKPQKQRNAQIAFTDPEQSLHSGTHMSTSTRSQWFTMNDRHSDRCAI
ncbi:hypothetical protein QQF64_003284 [Cirrhinus molitorella]|uniref:Uncharacterized protein n=1 Tax=Cirrhinus molitorella TaxID=172907 RepID=A0ABR3MKX3_9TELE